MSLVLRPSQDDVFKVVGRFLVEALPPGTPVVQGQVNRVAEPAADNFAVMWLLFAPRLATNLDEYADCAFTGSIAGTVMTVTAVQTGSIRPGAVVFGPGVAANTEVVSGPGGVGSYAVSAAQTLSQRSLASGTQSLTQSAEVVIQVDLHGKRSMDMSSRVSTLFRDQFAFDFFAAQGFGSITPLYADDPRQTPFINGEQQYETRLTVDLHAQVDFSIDVPQQFADELEIALVEATAYPS